MSAVNAVGRGADRPVVIMDEASVLIASPPPFDRSVSEEFVIPIEKFQFIHNYFSIAPSKPTDRIKLCLDGRDIQIIGISEEESLEEFKQAFGDIIHPVVRNAELA